LAGVAGVPDRVDVLVETGAAASTLERTAKLVIRLRILVLLQRFKAALPRLGALGDHLLHSLEIFRRMKNPRMLERRVRRRTGPYRQYDQKPIHVTSAAPR